MSDKTNRQQLKPTNNPADTFKFQLESKPLHFPWKFVFLSLVSLVALHIVAYDLWKLIPFGYPWKAVVALIALFVFLNLSRHIFNTMFQEHSPKQKTWESLTVVVAGLVVAFCIHELGTKAISKVFPTTHGQTEYHETEPGQLDHAATEHDENVHRPTDGDSENHPNSDEAKTEPAAPIQKHAVSTPQTKFALVTICVIIAWFSVRALHEEHHHLPYRRLVEWRSDGTSEFKRVSKSKQDTEPAQKETRYYFGKLFKKWCIDPYELYYQKVFKEKKELPAPVIKHLIIPLTSPTCIPAVAENGKVAFDPPPPKPGQPDEAEENETAQPSKVIEMSGNLATDISRLSRPHNWQQVLRAIQPHAEHLDSVWIVGSNGIADQEKRPPGFVDYADQTAGGSAGYFDEAKALIAPYLPDGATIKACNNMSQDALLFKNYADLEIAIGEIIDQLKREFASVDERQVAIDATGAQKTSSIVGAASTFKREALFQYVDTGSPHEVILFDVKLGNLELH